MNIGQVLEIHAGLACKNLGIKMASPVFDGTDNNDLIELIEEGNVFGDGKITLFDGQTGELLMLRLQWV